MEILNYTTSAAEATTTTFTQFCLK